MKRRILLMIGIFALAALLAFPLRETIYEVVVIPLAYLLWVLGLLYHALPQFIWWIAMGLFLAFLFARSLVPKIKPPERVVQKRKPPKGQVETLAEWMQKSQKGVYNKWLVANRLGRLAHEILTLREHGKPRSIFAPLEGPGWEPSPELKEYLHSGLQTSFADFPNHSSAMKHPQKTPLDHDPRLAIEFFETQLDHRRDSR